MGARSTRWTSVEKNRRELWGLCMFIVRNMTKEMECERRW